MKSFEQYKAKNMRRQGHSLNEITDALGVAKSSVSMWVRNIQLTKRQEKRLSTKGHSLGVIERRRKTRLANEHRRRQVIIDQAATDIGKVSKENLLFFGIAAYWGEGRKSSRGSVEFSNSDPYFVEVMMRFFKEVCRVPDHKFRGRLFLHAHLDAQKAERYWKVVSGIPTSQFQKTVIQKNKTIHHKDTLPMGTFTIGIYDTELFLKIVGWTEGFKNQLGIKI
jgi:predicted transcriptional regulator